MGLIALAGMATNNRPAVAACTDTIGVADCTPDPTPDRVLIAATGDLEVRVDAVTTQGVRVTGNFALTVNQVGTGTVTSDTDGIFVESLTSGTVTINTSAGSNVSALLGRAIRARSATGDLLVTQNGTLNGEEGVIAFTQGGGLVDILSNGAITATNGDGIRTRAVDGPTTVVSNATISANAAGKEADGIGIVTNGDGAISVSASATITAGNFTESDGVTARAEGTGDVTAIINAGADITALSGVGIRARGAGGNMVVIQDGTVNAEEGITSRTEGAGTVELTSNAAVTSVGGDAIRTQTATGTNTVTANATVTANSATKEVDAIEAISSDGDVTVTANAALSAGDFAGSDGIDARATGTGNVTVEMAATSTITALAGNGIRASSMGGSAMVLQNGIINASIGIGATNGGVGNVDVTSSALIFASDGDGIRAEVENGVATIVSNAAITADSPTQEADAIEVLSMDGDVAVTANAAISAGNFVGSDGIAILALGAAAISVETASAAAITALSGVGMTARSQGGDVTILQNGTIDAQSGIFAKSNLTATVTVTSNDRISTTVGDGIRAQSIDGLTTVTANAAITADSATIEADGIEATTEDGDVSVTVNAAISAGDIADSDAVTARAGAPETSQWKPLPPAHSPPYRASAFGPAVSAATPWFCRTAPLRLLLALPHRQPSLGPSTWLRMRRLPPPAATALPPRPKTAQRRSPPMPRFPPSGATVYPRPVQPPATSI